MIIAYNQLMEKIETEMTSISCCYCNYSEINDKDISVLMLCILYHNKILNRKSFTSRMKQYFEETQQRTNKVNKLCRRVGIYNSKLTKKWYSEISLTNILIDEVNVTCNDKNITIEKYLEYLNLGLNKNKNFCVDFIGVNVFNALINGYDSDYIYNFLKACNIDELKIEGLSYENADRNYDLSSGYCCSDCDGCLSQYKKSTYEYLYKKDDNKKINECLKKHFLSYKTHDKNKKCKITYNFN